MNNAKHRLELLTSNHIIVNPSILYKDKQIYLDNIINKLELLNPLSSLKRGFSVTYKNNKLVKDINDINIDDELNIKISNGEIIAKVTNKKEV